MFPLARHLENWLEKSRPARWKSQRAVSSWGRSRAAALPSGHLSLCGGALGIAALSGGTEGWWPCQQPVPQPVLSLRQRGRCLPRDWILMFAEGFETQCVVQSTNCSSQESKEMLRQVVPGQLGVLTLGWLMAHVPRDVGGHGGPGWSWGWHQLCWVRVPLVPLPQ